MKRDGEERMGNGEMNEKGWGRKNRKGESEWEGMGKGKKG